MLSDDDEMVSSKQGTACPHSIHKQHLACDICLLRGGLTHLDLIVREGSAAESHHLELTQDEPDVRVGALHQSL